MKQIARRDTRVSKIRSSECEVLLERDHEAWRLREWNNKKNLHETKVLSREVMKHDVFMSEVTRRIFTKRKFSWEKSRSMTSSWVEWRIDIEHLHVNETTQLLIFLFWKSIKQSWWEIKTLSTSQLSIFLFVESVNKSIVDFLSARRHQRISTIITFLSVETSLDKERDRSHTHTSNHLSLTNKSTLKTSNKKIWISLRFVSLSESVCYNDIQWIRYNDHQKHMRCFLRFFTSSQSIS